MSSTKKPADAALARFRSSLEELQGYYAGAAAAVGFRSTWSEGHQGGAVVDAHTRALEICAFGRPRRDQHGVRTDAGGKMQEIGTRLASIPHGDRMVIRLALEPRNALVEAPEALRCAHGRHVGAKCRRCPVRIATDPAPNDSAIANDAGAHLADAFRPELHSFTLIELVLATASVEQEYRESRRKARASHRQIIQKRWELAIKQWNKVVARKGAEAAGPRPELPPEVEASDADPTKTVLRTWLLDCAKRTHDNDDGAAAGVLRRLFEAAVAVLVTALRAYDATRPKKAPKVRDPNARTKRDAFRRRLASEGEAVDAGS